MGWRRAVVTLLVPLALVACGAPTLESDDFQGSAERLRGSVEDSQRLRLDSALDLVRQASVGSVPGTAAFSVDGMTAEDVMAEADRIELRREKAWLEEEIAGRRQLFADTERLAALAPRSLAVDDEDRLTFEVENGLEVPVTSGWVRTTLTFPDGRSVDSVDFVSFGDPLPPGEGRKLRTLVSGDARRHLPPPPEVRLEAEFTILENAGALVAKEPTEDEAARARAAIAEAERSLAEVERKLQAAGG